MEHKIDLVKQYDAAYSDILSSIEGGYIGKRQINRRISKKWNMAYSIVKELSDESDRIFNLNKTKQ
jgi:hypothetical protein